MLRYSSLLPILFVLATGAYADVPCPESCVTLGYAPADCSTLAERDTSTGGYCLDPPGRYDSRARYSLVLGTARADARSCYTANGSAEVVARDRFRLVGPAGDGAIAFEARLYVNGGASDYGNVEAGISEVGGEARSVSDYPWGGFNETLVLPLTHVVGDEFELHYRAYATASSTAYSTGGLSFVLPSGYAVTSCGGFVGDGAVPARPASWGAVKIRYR